MSLIGNKVIEKDLRNYLHDIGYVSESIHFEKLELVGIQRPGWVQLFSFDLTARLGGDGKSKRLFGLCLDDERTRRFEVFVDINQGLRDQQFSNLSRNLITLRRNSDEKLPVTYACLFACVLAAITIAALAIHFGGG